MIEMCALWRELMPMSSSHVGQDTKTESHCLSSIGEQTYQIVVSCGRFLSQKQATKIWDWYNEEWSVWKWTQSGRILYVLYLF